MTGICLELLIPFLALIVQLKIVCKQRVNLKITLGSVHYLSISFPLKNLPA